MRVDIAPLLAETLSLLEHSDELRPDHRIVTEAGSEPVPAYVDVNRMKQVFWNLAKNALKAMPQGGTLVARARRGPEGAQVSFADSGVGMSEDEVVKSFQPFHSTFVGGSGLGMSIVYRIVHEHGGRIQVQSRKGAGTTVTLALPAAAPAREAAWIAS